MLDQTEVLYYLFKKKRYVISLFVKFHSLHINVIKKQVTLCYIIYAENNILHLHITL